jgi:F420H(2)-dependent quinone reductase
MDTTARPRFRFSVPRGLMAGTLAAIALVWGPYALIPGSSLLPAQVQTGVYLGLLLLTSCSRRAKVLLARMLQRYIMNPLMRLLLAARISPYRLVILETRGHVTSKTRRVPVGNGRKDQEFWIIAEHGTAPAGCATSSTTPTSGCGCAPDCATAGYPGSPPSAPTMIRSPASGRSSPGTHCAH